MVFNPEIASYERKVRINPENEDRQNLFHVQALAFEVDSAISMMRNMTDLDDEEIFQEILDTVGSDISDYEADLLAERLGIN